MTNRSTINLGRERRDERSFLFHSGHAAAEMLHRPLRNLQLVLFFPAPTLFHAARARSSGATAQPGPASHPDTCDWQMRAWTRPSAPGRLVGQRSSLRLPGSLV